MSQSQAWYLPVPMQYKREKSPWREEGRKRYMSRLLLGRPAHAAGSKKLIKYPDPKQYCITVRLGGIERLACERVDGGPGESPLQSVGGVPDRYLQRTVSGEYDVFVVEPKKRSSRAWNWRYGNGAMGRSILGHVQVHRGPAGC